MALSVRSSSKNDSNTGTTMSVAEPTGAAVGDLIICLAQHNGNVTIVDNTALTVSATNLTSGEDSDGGSSETTASITPSANKLILASVTSRTGTSTDPVEPTITGCGLTWVKIGTAVYDSTGSSRRRITLFRAMGSSPSAGSLTIDHGGQAQTDVVWTVDEITNADTSGTNGSGAIVQSATQVDESVTTSYLTVTLGAFSNTNNATYGVFANYGDIAQTTTAGSGFSKVGEKLNTATSLHIASEFKATSDTSVDLTFSNAASQMGGIAIEIKAATIFTEDINDWQPIPTSGSTLSIFSRVKQSGDPSTYNFTAGSSGRWACIAIALQGNSPSYDVAPNTSNGGTTDNASSGQQVIPAITTGVDNTIHIVLCGWDTSATGTITIPTGYTLLQSANSGGQPLSASYKAIATASSTGATTYDNTEFGARIGLSFSVKEAGSSITTRTVTAKARISQAGVTKTVTAKGRVKQGGVTKTVTAKARVKQGGITKTITAKARLFVSGTSKTVTAKARVKQSGVTKTVTAKARIILLNTKTVTAKARIFASGITKTITAKASIAGVSLSKTVTAKARVKQSGVTKTVTAPSPYASVWSHKTITVRAYIASPLAGYVDMRSLDQNYQRPMMGGDF